MKNFNLLFDAIDMQSIHTFSPAESSEKIPLTSDEEMCYYDSLEKEDAVDLSEYDTITENMEDPDWNLLKDIQEEISDNDEISLGAGAPIFSASIF